MNDEVTLFISLHLNTEQRLLNEHKLSSEPLKWLSESIGTIWPNKCQYPKKLKKELSERKYKI